ncbi:DUF3014 domain-containing protein [Thalassotalea mangrovi]|uniref:DUF3014 domain-containing protein n=1 Tax=Thalassotalea mangrovi TaxID=2572245 RepID=A0A4U1B4K3_9GAMM|nr:DUF3014 domain-containing protein [Thalassotalea mangrovi]TKB44684.1 DUF3014 domain-containing protein [Thalassotalea mangrovi]
MNAEQKQSTDTQSSGPLGIIIIIIVLVLLGAGYYMFFIDNPADRPQPDIVDLKDEKLKPEPEIQEPEDTEPEPIEPEPEPVTTPEPQPEMEPEEDTLPELDNSDELTLGLIREVSMSPQLLDILVPTDVLRRTVVFADNFAKGQVATKEAPVYSPDGTFQASPVNDNEFVISPENYSRYQSYIELAASFEPKELVAMYEQLSPLLEEAYQELGYPERSFDQVRDDVISQILAFEYPEQSPVLIQPGVVYKYQSEDIEGRSDVDKLLLRIGKENVLQLQTVAYQLQKEFNQ